MALRERGKYHLAQMIEYRTPIRSGNVVGSFTATAPDRSGLLEPTLRWPWRASGYTIWSFATPVAWYTLDAGWTIPYALYSPTMADHQAVIRELLLEPDPVARWYQAWQTALLVSRRRRAPQPQTAFTPSTTHDYDCPAPGGGYSPPDLYCLACAMATSPSGA